MISLSPFRVVRVNLSMDKKLTRHSHRLIQVRRRCCQEEYFEGPAAAWNQPPTENDCRELWEYFVCHCNVVFFRVEDIGCSGLFTASSLDARGCRFGSRYDMMETPWLANYLMRQTQLNILRRPTAKKVFRLAIAFLCMSPASARPQGQATQLQDVIRNASSARDQGNISLAITLYQRAVQLDPTWSEGWWYIGSMQYGSDAYGPAILALSHYIDLTPTAGPAYALRGLCEFEEAQYPESLKDLQHAIVLGAAAQPRNAGIIIYHEALLLTKMGSFEQAISKYSDMVKHGSANPDIMTAIGLAGLRLPMLPKEVEPEHMALVSATGQAAAAFMNGDIAAADRGFQDLFVRYPSTANLHLFYGYLLFSADSDRAIEQFQKELLVSPNSAETRSMLAWAYGLRGNYKASLSQAQQAVEETPTLTIAQLVLGRALVETGDVDAGVQHLLIVVTVDPQNLDAHLALAKAYSKLGRKEDARRERLQCLAITRPEATPNATM